MMIKETILAEDEYSDEEEVIIESIREERDIEIEKLRVDSKSSIAGKSLLDIGLRSFTGATILSIERGKKLIKNPKPKEAIRSGDVLLVIGNEEERKKAKEYIESGAAKGEKGAGTEKLTIGPDSKIVGKNLIEIGLRSLTGTTIISIERGGKVISHPKPEDPVKEGDVLLVIGTEEERKKAKELIG